MTCYDSPKPQGGANSERVEHASGIDHHRPLSMNTANAILTSACKAIGKIEAQATRQVDELGVQWESEIRKLRAEFEQLRKDVDELLRLEGRTRS